MAMVESSTLMVQFILAKLKVRKLACADLPILLKKAGLKFQLI